MEHRSGYPNSKDTYHPQYCWMNAVLLAVNALNSHLQYRLIYEIKR